MKLVKLLLAIILLLIVGGILYLGMADVKIEQKPVTVDYKGTTADQPATASPLPPQPQPQAQPLTPMPEDAPATTSGTAPAAHSPDE